VAGQTLFLFRPSSFSSSTERLPLAYLAVTKTKIKFAAAADGGEGAGAVDADDDDPAPPLTGWPGQSREHECEQWRGGRVDAVQLVFLADEVCKELEKLSLTQSYNDKIKQEGII